MDDHHYFNRSARKSTVSAGASAHSNDSEKILSKVYRALRPFLYLSATIFSGYWAFEATQRTTLRNWESHHSPSSRVWEGALKSKGFQKVEDLQILYQATRTLPQLFDRAPVIWLSENRYWIAVLGQKSSSDAPLLLSAAPIPTLPTERLPGSVRNKFSQEWHLIGQGWSGFETLLRILEENPPLSSISAPISRPEQSKRDARELHY
jgi:hypothetical protein